MSWILLTMLATLAVRPGWVQPGYDTAVLMMSHERPAPWPTRLAHVERIRQGTLALSRRFSRVLSADSSRGMLDVLANKTKAAGITNIQPLFLDLEDSAATPPTVDAIVSSMTLHHVRDIPRLAGIFLSMLRPGGHIALADLSTEAGDFHSDNTGVRHFGFDADWLRATFASAGFADARTMVAYTARKQVASAQAKAFPIRN
jgi:tRNA (cmo5U34)-methyltransferase